MSWSTSNRKGESLRRCHCSE